MKLQPKEKIKPPKSEDDTLFGLLSSYKIYNTYFRILKNEQSDSLIAQITSNPKKWPKIEGDRYNGFRQLKRSELDIIKLSVKYLLPEHLLAQLGPTIGINITENEAAISNSLDTDGYYSIETNSKYLPNIISAIEKIIELSPEKKYELLEKYFS